MSWFRRELSEAGKAGYGPESDGVPTKIGSESVTLPRPIGTKLRLEEVTTRIRKAR